MGLRLEAIAVALRNDFAGYKLEKRGEVGAAVTADG
jgi:hypothetical protein